MKTRYEPDSSIGKSTYWDQYYNCNNYDPPPSPLSQFAAFVLNEVSQGGQTHIVEIASGNGRDTLFFAMMGCVVTAIEKSGEAVKYIRKVVSDWAAENTLLPVKVIEADALNCKLRALSTTTEQTAYYSRFFIHTLSEIEVKIFFDNLSGAMRPGDKLYLEYSNHKDAKRQKCTDPHFRCFHHPNFILETASKKGLVLEYDVCGTGLAKWKNDDASVTRQIFSRRAG